MLASIQGSRNIVMNKIVKNNRICILKGRVILRKQISTMYIMSNDDSYNGGMGIEIVLRAAILNRVVREDFSAKLAFKQTSEESEGVHHVVI